MGFNRFNLIVLGFTVFVGYNRFSLILLGFTWLH